MSSSMIYYISIMMENYIQVDRQTDGLTSRQTELRPTLSTLAGDPQQSGDSTPTLQIKYSSFCADNSRLRCVLCYMLLKICLIYSSLEKKEAVRQRATS